MCSSEVAFGDDPNYKTHPQIYPICNTLAKMEGKKLYVVSVFGNTAM